MEEAFKLFASCIPVKGAKRFVICDLQRSELFFVPEGLYIILTEYENRTIRDIKNIFEDEFNDQIDIHLKYLIENELGFLTTEPQKFPKLEISWDMPELISNIIIEVDENSNHDYTDIFEQLVSVGCQFMELRFYSPISFQKLNEIIQLTDTSKLRNINLILPFQPEVLQKDLEILMLQFQRIGNIIIHSVMDSFVSDPDVKNIFYTTDIIKNNDCCGQVSHKYFSINMTMFMESQFHNSCLNKKVSIDSKGNLKNCPSITGTFGNIRSSKIKEILSDNEFTKLWNINKDQIEICKDCEFRYICTDCRAFRTNDSDMFSKPLKCAYDPYSATWDYASIS